MGDHPRGWSLMHLSSTQGYWQRQLRPPATQLEPLDARPQECGKAGPGLIRQGSKGRQSELAKQGCRGRNGWKPSHGASTWVSTLISLPHAGQWAAGWTQPLAALLLSTANSQETWGRGCWGLCWAQQESRAASMPWRVRPKGKAHSPFQASVSPPVARVNSREAAKAGCCLLAVWTLAELRCPQAAQGARGG